MLIDNIDSDLLKSINFKSIPIKSCLYIFRVVCPYDVKQSLMKAKNKPRLSAY